MYILFINDSFAVTISKSQWYVAHPDPICISASSFPGLVSAAEKEYPKVTQQWPLATLVLLGLLGTKALLSIKGLLRRGKKSSRIMVGNCKIWSTSGCRENAFSETLFYHPIPSFPRTVSMSLLVVYTGF